MKARTDPLAATVSLAVAQAVAALLETTRCTPADLLEVVGLDVLEDLAGLAFVAA